ncbi:hypothetical protein BDQ17DRAFT_1427883 [Cyathus striatus]|nr:hypothetical protein BDQ17DRAFT_1427883 [Cyathus striatus]
MKPLTLLPLLLSAVVGQTLTQYIVYNACPAPINLYINGVYDSLIPIYGNTTKFFDHTAAAIFYSDINGGNSNGAATRAVVNLTVPQGYYYIVKDTSHLILALVFPLPLLRILWFRRMRRPSQHRTAHYLLRSPSFMWSPERAVHYNILSFGRIPGKSSAFGSTQTILTQRNVWMYAALYLLTVPRSKCGYDCNGTPAQNWEIQRESTKVRLAGTQFCLDAGSSPANGMTTIFSM